MSSFQRDTMTPPVLAFGYLVRCRIPSEDLQGLCCPTVPPRFKDGFVRLVREDSEVILTWVNAFDEPKTVTTPREAMRLGSQMAHVVTKWILQRNAAYPVPAGLTLHA